jgi:hypothetical protein
VIEARTGAAPSVVGQASVVVQSRYRIVVQGELSARYSTAFNGMSLECGGGNTVLAGPVEDQAHLLGLIQQISRLGLVLVSVAPEHAP